MLRLSIFLIAIPLLAQDTGGTGSISGVATDAAGAPVADARICVVGTGRCAATNSTGAFRIDSLRAGNYTLEIRGMTQPVEVRAGVDSTIAINMLKLNGGRESVTVTASVLVAPEEVKTSGFLVSGSEVFRDAGAQQDVVRYVQSLPGVALGSDDLRNDLIVRGGSPLENLFIVDNVEIPNINAFANFASAGGTVSILDAALIQDVTFLTGGYPAPFINRTSSVLQVTEREGNREGFRGRATLGFAGVGTILEGPIQQGKGSWIVSARRSFLDAFTSNVGFGGVPVLYTFNAKAVYDLTARDRIWAVSISGTDTIRLGADKNNSKKDEEVNNFDIRYSGWRTANGFNWQRLFGDRGVGLLGVTHSEASVGSTIKDLLRNGGNPAAGNLDQLIASSPTVFRENSREGESTVKYDLTLFGQSLGKIQVGGSFKIFRVHYDTASPYGTDSPYSLTIGSNPFTLRRDFLTYQTGAYFQDTRNVTSRLNLTWGGRFDNYDYLGQSRFSPRAGLSYRLNSRLSWKASYGIYYQQPFLLFLADFPQNRGLVPFRADHYVTGFSYAARDTLRITAEVYRKNYKDYPVSSQFPALSLANLGDTFNVRDILFPLVSAGRGRSQGVEILVEKKFSAKWYGQVNAAFSSSRQAGLDGIQRLASFDYPRIVNLTGGYHLSAKWQLSTRLAYLAGRPYTPFDAVNSTEQSRGIYDLTKVNAVRLPDYIRLDLRADRTFTVRGKPLLVFFGIQNAFDRKNIAGYTWNRRTNHEIRDDQMGAFPIFGVDWRF